MQDKKDDNGYEVAADEYQHVQFDFRMLPGRFVHAIWIGTNSIAAWFAALYRDHEGEWTIATRVTFGNGTSWSNADLGYFSPISGRGVSLDEARACVTALGRTLMIDDVREFLIDSADPQACRKALAVGASGNHFVLLPSVTGKGGTA